MLASASRYVPQPSFPHSRDNSLVVFLAAAPFATTKPHFFLLYISPQPSPRTAPCRIFSLFTLAKRTDLSGTRTAKTTSSPCWTVSSVLFVSADGSGCEVLSDFRTPGVVVFGFRNEGYAVRVQTKGRRAVCSCGRPQAERVAVGRIVSRA